MTRRRRQPGLLRRPGDLPAMTEAIDWFEQRGLAVERVSPLQLKFRELNYYPHCGTMNFDQFPRMEARGLAALSSVIDELASTAASEERTARKFFKS